MEDIDECQDQKLCYLPILSLYLNRSDVSHCKTKQAMVCTLEYFLKVVAKTQVVYIII